MNRYTLRQPIPEALALLPVAIRRRVAHAHFATGVDPCFVGLHDYPVAGDGRSFADTAHVAYSFLQRGGRERVTTVVLPKPATRYTLVHELGHVLHETIGFAWAPAPVSAYARLNPYEAFAEAFAPDLFAEESWWDPPDLDVLHGDQATLALFEELAR